MFVDASAMVAILTGEPERSALLGCFDTAKSPMTSALAMFEAAAALSRKKAQSLTDSERHLGEFVRLLEIRIIPLAEREGIEAFSAFRRFGKGFGHPAKLNMGDCFAYACASAHDVPLLFVGNEFSQTDIRSALP